MGRMQYQDYTLRINDNSNRRLTDEELVNDWQTHDPHLKLLDKRTDDGTLWYVYSIRRDYNKGTKDHGKSDPENMAIVGRPDRVSLPWDRYGQYAYSERWLRTSLNGRTHEEAGIAADVRIGGASDTPRLALNGQEFREVVWPELPSSRSERGVPVSCAWNDLHQKSTNALRRLVSRWGGRTYTLLDVTYDGETTHYETFQVHRETRLHVRDTSGEEHEVHFYDSTLVRENEFKIFSFVVD